jgi:hypothetical protein
VQRREVSVCKKVLTDAALPIGQLIACHAVEAASRDVGTCVSALVSSVLAKRIKHSWPLALQRLQHVHKHMVGQMHTLPFVAALPASM